MKKVFVLIAVAASLIGLASCDKDTNKCWEVTSTTTVGGAEVKTTSYMWDTENHMDVYVEEMKKASTTVTYKSASSYKNAVDCTAANVQ